MGSKIVSGIDLFPTLLGRIGHPAKLEGYACRSFDSPLDPERVYFSADMRLWDRNRRDRGEAPDEPSPDNPSSYSAKLLNATAMKIVDWKDDGNPATLLQATHYVPTDRFYYAFYDFDPELPPYRFHRFDPSPHVHVPITSLEGRSRLTSELALLSASLTAQFPWVEGDYRQDLESGSLPDWFRP